MANQFFNHDACEKFLNAVCGRYEVSAPTVTSYADDVYRRLNEAKPVQLKELTALQSLQTEAGWLPPTLAANLVYKLEASLGRDTTGQAGF